MPAKEKQRQSNQPWWKFLHIKFTPARVEVQHLSGSSDELPSSAVRTRIRLVFANVNEINLILLAWKCANETSTTTPIVAYKKGVTTIKYGIYLKDIGNIFPGIIAQINNMHPKNAPHTIPHGYLDIRAEIEDADKVFYEAAHQLPDYPIALQIACTDSDNGGNDTPGIGAIYPCLGYGPN